MTKKTRGPRMGRPPLPKGKVKAAIFSIRLSPAERATVERAAGARRASEWAREVILRAADAARNP